MVPLVVLLTGVLLMASCVALNHEMEVRPLPPVQSFNISEGLRDTKAPTFTML